MASIQSQNAGNAHHSLMENKGIQEKFDGTCTAILMYMPGANEEDSTTGSMAISAEGENISYCAGYNWTGTHDGTADIRYQYYT